MGKRLLAAAMAGATSLMVLPALAQPVLPQPVLATADDARIAQTGDWGPTVDGRWAAGAQAPGGWAAYRTPVEGFILSPYWRQTAYQISNPAYYALPVPQPGYGWSRYYDDAVLTDRYGRVLDSRVLFDWDRHDTAPAPPPPAAPRVAANDRGGADDGRVLGSVLVGGVAGGLIGTAAAGPNDRAGGAIIGAGLGAVAGGALAAARDDGAGYDDRARLAAERRAARHDAHRQRDWVRQQRRLDRDARRSSYAGDGDYVRLDDRRAGLPPADDDRTYAAMRGDAVTVSDGQSFSGYGGDGCYYPGVATTTITIQPGETITTTTTTTTYTGR